MRAVDLDNLDLESAQRAIQKARQEKPWCNRDKKNPNLYRVCNRHKVDSDGREHKPAWVTFIFSRGVRMATCTCDGMWFGAEAGKICYHIARAYFKHLHNLRRDELRRQRLAFNT